MSDPFFLPSYKAYPAHRAFINTLVHHTPQTHTQYSYYPYSPSKAFPESSSAGKACVDKVPWLHVQHDATLLECPPAAKVAFIPALFFNSNYLTLDFILAVILSALRNLQEKIRRLEFEKEQAELSLYTLGKDVRCKRQESDSTQNLPNDKDPKRQTSDPSNCNQGEKWTNYVIKQLFLIPIKYCIFISHIINFILYNRVLYF